MPCAGALSGLYCLCKCAVCVCADVQRPQAAAHAGIDVQQRSMAMDELQDVMLSGQWLVLILVDKTKLVMDAMACAELALGTAVGAVDPAYTGTSWCCKGLVRPMLPETGAASPPMAHPPSSAQGTT